ncbi:hypothetical protein L3i20_v222810 [Paenibacillus sp. L3-i20]|nr:hypothetical protein L3i20_v222810 [Paenibacillus sp. L3-i20]
MGVFILNKLRSTLTVHQSPLIIVDGFYIAGLTLDINNPSIVVNTPIRTQYAPSKAHL